jgi:hypothetical protein
LTERFLVLPPGNSRQGKMFIENNVQYFIGKSKRCFVLAKTQREGADKLEALGHELKAKADEIKAKIQHDRRN